MIKANKGEVIIEGGFVELTADLACIVHCLHDDVFIKGIGMTEDEAKERIHEAVEMGFIPEEELHKKNDETVGEVLGDIIEKAIDLLEKLTGGGHKE